MKKLLIFVFLSILFENNSFSIGKTLEFGNKNFDKSISYDIEDKVIDLSINNNDLILNIFVVSILLFISTIFYKNSKQIILILKALFDFKIVIFLVNQKNYIVNNLLNIFNFIYFIILSLFFFYGINYIKAIEKNTLFISFITLIFFIIIKFLFSNHLNLLKKQLSQYYKIIAKITNTVNLLLLIILVFLLIYLSYEKISFSIKVFFLIILIVSIIGRIQIIFKIADDIFLKLYFILYLCTLEILPIIIGFKLLTKYISVI